LDGKLNSRPRLQLSGMQPRFEACRDTRLENGPGLVDVECASVAEDVDPSGERRARLEHRAGHQIDVAVAVVAELGGYHVCTQERRLQGELAGDPQRPRLVGDGQTVAALG